MEIGAVRTLYSTSIPSADSAFSSSARTRALRYWSDISWYSVSESSAAEAEDVEGSWDSVSRGAGSEESGSMPLALCGVVER